MQDRGWFIASFPTPLIFRYHLPLRWKHKGEIMTIRDPGRRPAPPPHIRTEDTPTIRTGTRTDTATTIRSPWRLQRPRRLWGSPRRTWQQEPRPRTDRRAALLLDRVATQARSADNRASRTSWKKKQRKSTIKIKNFIAVIFFLVSYSNIIL